MAETFPQQWGKYILLQRIAVGGMAEIFRAKTTGAEGFSRDVAIKRILSHFSEDETFVRMFVDEANIASKLHHANLVQIFDFDIHEGRYYIAMEFIEGRDLHRIREVGEARKKPLTPFQVAHIGVNVCAGLQYAHEKSHKGKPLNIVHRDISPHNIMVSFTGEVKVMDFGIAKAAQRFTKTQVGMVKGKCAYMSPEQARGKDLDGRSDLFALATVLWEVLTNRRLFAGSSDFESLSNVLNLAITPPSEINPAVPPELDAILLKALDRDRDKRYVNAQAFEHALNKFIYTHVDNPDSVAVGPYMKDLFADEIRVFLEQQSAEKTAIFEGPASQLAEAKEKLRVQDAAAAADSASLPLAPSADLGAPPPVLSAPRPAPPVPAAPAERTAESDITPAAVSREAATLPVGELQKEVNRIVSGGVSGAAAAAAPASLAPESDLDWNDEEVRETMAMPSLAERVAAETAPPDDIGAGAETVALEAVPRPAAAGSPAPSADDLLSTDRMSRPGPFDHEAKTMAVEALDASRTPPRPGKAIAATTGQKPAAKSDSRTGPSLPADDVDVPPRRGWPWWVLLLVVLLAAGVGVGSVLVVRHFTQSTGDSGSVVPQIAPMTPSAPASSAGDTAEAR